MSDRRKRGSKITVSDVANTSSQKLRKSGSSSEARCFANLFSKIMIHVVAKITVEVRAKVAR